MADSSDFLKFVASRLNLDAASVPEAGRMFNVGNTIGAICLRVGLLKVDQLDAIVEAQSDHKQKRFGEIAVELGMLTETQVARVLELQRLNRCLEHGALLALDGRVEFARLADLLAEFTKVNQIR